MTSPDCAVLIVNWNTWTTLRRCLQALARQTYKQFRVYIIDNDSSEPLPADITSIVPDTVYIQNEQNRGFAAANNQLLAMTTQYPWIALLNPDAYPEPNWLQQLMETARQQKGYDCFASRLLLDDQKQTIDGEGDVYHLTGLAWRGRHDQTATMDVTNREVFSACAAAALYRGDVIRSVGGFDEDFFCYIEDVDLGFRLRLLGHRCLLVPAAVVYHTGSASSGGKRSKLSVYFGHRNMVWCFVKNMPSPLFWLLSPLHLLMNLFAILWLTLRGQGLVGLRARWGAIKGLPAMFRKRRQVQATRYLGNAQVWQLLDKRLWLRRNS
jgi:GT2 family glycosyltransferase